MIIRRTSEATGKEHSRDIDVDRGPLLRWLMSDPMTRPYIQDQFPHLSADDREFIKTGITPEEWDDIFGEEE